jgi:hypothetical protein
MGQGLREVSHESTMSWIELFGKQPHIISLSDQLFKECFCVSQTSCSCKILNHPKETSDKGRLTVLAGIWRQAINESIFAEFLLDDLHRSSYAIIVEWKKTKDR